MSPDIPPPPPPVAPTPSPTKLAQKAVNPLKKMRRAKGARRSPLTIRRASVSTPMGGTGVNTSN